MSILSTFLFGDKKPKYATSIGDEAANRTAGLRSAINAQYAGKVDPTRRSILGGFADSGFGLSGLANQGISQGLADLEAQRQQAEQNALLGAQSSVQSERQAAEKDRRRGLLG